MFAHFYANVAQKHAKLAQKRATLAQTTRTCAKITVFGGFLRRISAQIRRLTNFHTAPFRAPLSSRGGRDGGGAEAASSAPGASCSTATAR